MPAQHSETTRETVAVVGVLALIAMSPQRPTFRAGVDTVQVYATVSDRDGRLVPDLPREEFQLWSALRAWDSAC